MSHEIDLEKFSVYSDLALDYDKNKLTSKENYIDDIKITYTKLDEYTSKLIGKKKGKYITIEFDDVTDFQNKEKVKKVFKNELKKIISKICLKKDIYVLVVGLGNRLSTPDSLGPLSIDNIIVTNHLYELSTVEEGFARVSVIAPGVTGSTGIETIKIIKGIVDKINPDLVIAIDSLASGSISRLNRTIQMTDTGISPGSGVGNKREEISYETIGVPVIAIGVPTVVDAATIVSDTIKYLYKNYSYNKQNKNNLKNKLITANNINYLSDDLEVTEEDKKNLFGMIGMFNEEEIKELFFEILTPIGYNLMVTPKEVDFTIEKLSDIVGNGINMALHEKVDK